MIHSYTYTNLFTAELIDRGYRFLARDEDGSLYAYKTEPNYDGSCWNSAQADEIPLFPSCIEERIADWNLNATFRRPCWWTMPSSSPENASVSEKNLR